LVVSYRVVAPKSGGRSTIEAGAAQDDNR
jgi:hypothetical protein